MTHYGNELFLTLIDCGESRFTIWRKINHEDADTLAAEIVQIFRERGPPAELLMDNGPAFRSAKLNKVFGMWGVRPVYRCAYRPAGNGIVERIHRTIKRMAARAHADPRDMAYWYNMAPKNGTNTGTVPASMLHNYSWRLPMAEKVPDGNNVADFTVGQSMYVKPPAARCTTTWPVGIVTASCWWFHIH